VPNRQMAAFRLPTQALADIDRLAAALQKRSPGKVSKADALAWAVARALGELDEQDRQEKAKSSRAKPPAGWSWRDPHYNTEGEVRQVVADYRDPLAAHRPDQPDAAPRQPEEKPRPRPIEVVKQ
jgi:hypothetical protein